MRVFIDESGSFASYHELLVHLVGAQPIPERKFEFVKSKYARSALGYRSKTARRRGASSANRTSTRSSICSPATTQFLKYPYLISGSTRKAVSQHISRCMVRECLPTSITFASPTASW
jgi:hypothetical protein